MLLLLFLMITLPWHKRTLMAKSCGSHVHMSAGIRIYSTDLAKDRDYWKACECDVEPRGLESEWFLYECIYNETTLIPKLCLCRLIQQHSFACPG